MTRFRWPRLFAPLLILILTTSVMTTFQHSAAAGQRTQIITKRFSSIDTVTIPERGAATPYPAPIRVAGLDPGKVKDVNVTLRGLTHEFPGDLEVLLVAPGGRNALIIGDICYAPLTAVAGLVLTLDDEAAVPLPPDDVLATGSYRPADYNPADSAAFPEPAPSPSGAVSLSTFDGIDPNGTWRLFVIDDVSGGGGTIATGWTLTITARVKQDR